MTIRCPTLSRISVVADDPHLAAALSCALAERGTYLPVMDGPRLTRVDRDAEIVRRNNALARVRAKATFLAGLPVESQAAMIAHLPKDHALVVTWQDVAPLAVSDAIRNAPPLEWGNDRLGLGVLTAINERRLLKFTDAPSPRAAIPSRSGHLVICEAGHALTEVIAANYAYSLGAGLHIIDETNDDECDQLIEAYYGIDEPGKNAMLERERLKQRLRELVGGAPVPQGGSLSFITKKLPFGAAYPEVPSTHLFAYPDLGIAVVNGFAAEQSGTRGTNVAVLVDPEKVQAPEIDAAAKLLPERGILVRAYRGNGATVRAVTDMANLFPYDLLLFATHCGDASGYRETYEFRDSEGNDRRLVVDIALGVGETDDPEILSVVIYQRFVSLDGVDWTDPVAKAKLHVGPAILDFTEMNKAGRMKPVHQETIARVHGSAAMMMADNNYLLMSTMLAAGGSPIVINNACVSWHELAGRFMFANVRAYAGTLFSVSDIEAEAIVVRVLDKFFGKPLAHAFWSAQNAVYGAGGDRRPYVVTGVYPQRLRATKEHVPGHILRHLLEGAREWKARLDANAKDKKLAKRYAETVAYYDQEIADLRARRFVAPKK